MNTMQQEFDAVVQHLYKQGRPAQTGTSCCYRTDDGLMCAVGCRIPDDMYLPEMEGNVIRQLIDKDFVLPSEVAAYKDMFDDLQWAHDSWNDGGFDNVERGLMEVADRYGLTYNDPRNIK